MRPLNIAMIGTRGVPATYGGIERHVEEIGARIANRGHRLTIYARHDYLEQPTDFYRGMRVKSLSTVNSKHLEAFLHSGHAAMDSLLRSFDVVHYHAVGPGLFSPVSRYASRAVVVQTIHGRDDQRDKWGGLAQRALRVGAWLSSRVPDRTIVVSKDLASDYLASWGRRTVCIPNGTPDPTFRPAQEITRRWGLQGGDYVLALGRLVPEKDAASLIRGFRDVRTDAKLVIVGGSSHSDEYVEFLHSLAEADPRVIMTGYQYGAVLEELLSNARIFAQPSLLEGLPLTLLEAAGYGVPILASDIGPHVEVLSSVPEGAAMFEVGNVDDLSAKLRIMLARHGGEHLESLAADVRGRYSWDRATDMVLETYAGALQERASTSRRRAQRFVPQVVDVRSPRPSATPAIPQQLRKSGATVPMARQSPAEQPVSRRSPAMRRLLNNPRGVGAV